MPEADRAKLARDQWDNLGRSTFELPWMDELQPSRGRVELINGERLEAIRKSGKPVVFISGHFANWEVMPCTIVDAGVVCQMTYRAANNPYVDKLIRDARARYGVRLFAPKGSDGSRELLEAMKTNPGGADPMTLGGLQLLMLTFVRTTELIAADWSEINWKEKVWTIPAERMKGKRGSRKEHLVPLSDQTLKILDELQKITGPDGLIFKSIRTKTGYISNNTLNMALKRMGFDNRMCGHGFRTLALTNIQEQLKIDLRIVDRQLAHIEKNKVTAAYNRAEYWDERVAMMQRWADLLDAQSLK
jgi:integrase